MDLIEKFKKDQEVLDLLESLDVLLDEVKAEMNKAGLYKRTQNRLMSLLFKTMIDRVLTYADYSHGISSFIIHFTTWRHNFSKEAFALFESRDLTQELCISLIFTAMYCVMSDWDDVMKVLFKNSGRG